MPSSGVFVLLPILNEADCIQELLDRIEGVLAGRDYLVGILDDGSTDGTLEIVETWMEAHPGRGHLIRGRKPGPGCYRGAALNRLMRWGLAHTRHDIFVEMDGDLSHLPEEMPPGLRLIEEGHDVVIASKYLSGSREVHRHALRRFVSFVNTGAATWLLNPRISDYSNGFRFYRRSAAELLARHVPENRGPVYLGEVLAIWMREGMRVCEFPSTYIGRKTGHSKVIVRDVVRGGLALLRIAFRYHFTGFRRAGEAPAIDAPPRKHTAGL